MNNEQPTHLDIFSGLGAWTIAGHNLGFKTIAFCESDKRCADFLAKAWPGIPILSDVRTVNGRDYLNVDVLTAGVPCQPASRAGKQRGASDDRWLWPATLALIEAARPRCCVFENPPGIGDVGIDGILAEMESKGYEVAPIFDIPACAVDSPQLRHRFYIVAFAKCPERRQETEGWNEPDRNDGGREEKASGDAQCIGVGNVAHPNKAGRVTRRNTAAPARYRNPVESNARTGVGLADATIAGHEETDSERGQDGRGAKYSEGDAIGVALGDAEKRGRRQGSQDARGTCGGTGTAAEWVGHSNPTRDGVAQGHTAEAGREERQPDENDAHGFATADHWANSVWLPCADGKVRRAPDDSFGVVNGLHRSLLGALGNSQVPQVAEIILRAVKSVLAS